METSLSARADGVQENESATVIRTSTLAYSHVARVKPGEILGSMYLNAATHRYILGTRVDATSYEAATQLVTSWARAGQSRYVCAANVHMVMESYDNDHFRRVVNSADLVTADGMPLVWLLKKMGVDDAERVYGPDLMLRVCEAAQDQGIPVGFYGGHADYLQRLISNMTSRYPRLNVSYAYAPPFVHLDTTQDDRVVDSIKASGARIVFVSLGCPKQERWMLQHKGRVRAVMLGVGAAFDFYSDRVRQAPSWVQRCGLEWLYRLFREPRRLFSRYARTCPRFVSLVLLHGLGITGIGRAVRTSLLSPWR